MLIQQYWITSDLTLITISTAVLRARYASLEIENSNTFFSLEWVFIMQGCCDQIELFQKNFLPLVLFGFFVVQLRWLGVRFIHIFALSVLSISSCFNFEGVNLPAHTVIICGTSVFNAEKGKMVELGILDVQQIFGRAGRPQFDSTGDAILITDSQENLNHYLNLIVSSVPIESGFIKNLMDHLNAGKSLSL